MKIIDIQDLNDSICIIGDSNDAKPVYENGKIISGTCIQRFENIEGKSPLMLVNFDENAATFIVLHDCIPKIDNNGIMLKKGEKISVASSGIVTIIK